MRGLQAFAVVFSVLLVTVTLTPIGLAASQPYTGDPPHIIDRAGYQSTSETPFGQKTTALSLLRELPDSQSDIRVRAVTTLNGTFSAYRDGTHINDEQVFHDDAEAVRIASKAAGSSPSIVNDSTWLIVSADRRTANQSVQEAQRAFSYYEDEIEPQGQRESTEQAIENAERAMEKAERVLERSKNRERLRKQIVDRARALKFYAQAWRHSQRALDKIDRVTAPEVSFDSRADPIRFDDRSVNYTLSGTVYDVRPYELENVTVTVEGREFTVSLTNETAAIGNTTFEFTTTLETRSTELTVTASDEVRINDEDENNDRGKNGNRGPPAEKDDEGVRTEQNDTAVIKLDGDGLPDRYETSVLKTDPLNPDSDSAVTEADEANNSVLDGREDFDEDGLPTRLELAFDTDPFVADTDGDGLSDAFEARQDPPIASTDRFDPLDSDTDGDGVPDGKEDHDNDTLTTLEEVKQGTEFDNNDTDTDGIEDGRELELGTNATLPDTDSDGLSDGTELTLPTDPTDPDTDDDGVLDGNESFVTVARNASTGVNVSVRGQGNVAETVSITPKPTYFEGTSANAGPTVRLTNQSAFESATVRIPIDDSIPASEYDDLSIYTWNGSANDVWSPINTTINNGTAVAQTDQFSFFTVLDSEEWISATTVPTSGGGDASPISFAEQEDFTCSDACSVSDETTLLLGGEPSARKITVEQGDESFQVVPLSNGQRIEEFYDYGDAEINSPLPIAKADTSRLFFWSGPEGISLVVLHDKPRDGSGGAVDLAFEGLPFDSGSWVVNDDPGDFRGAGSRSQPAWSWNFDNTDGGVFRGGLTDQTVTVTPYFNEEASRDPLTPGELSRWEVLTGQATAPEDEELSMDEPVTIQIPDAPAEDGSDVPEGDSGTASFQYDLGEDVTEIAVRYQTEQTNVDPSATIRFEGPEGTTIEEPLNIGTVGTVEEVIDVSSLGTGTVDITISADGVDARAQVIPRGTQIDSDGDGIADWLEDREWTARNGPAQTFNLSSDKPDTDGDGIPDGDEANFAVETVDGERRVSVTLSSNPDKVDTDEDGLDDGEERELRTNPLLVDTDADGLPDAEDPQPTVPSGLSDDSEQPFHLEDGEPTQEFLDGMVYGDWGYVNDRAGSRTAAYLFGWFFPYLWIAFGTVPVIEDGVEVALEVRECLAINKELWENALDCGFAAWELATTGAKIIGAATSITGVGAALATTAFAADEAADLGRAVTIAVEAMAKYPVSKIRPAGRMVGKQFAGVGVDFVRRVVEQLPGAKGSALLRGVRQGQLENAGLSTEVAEQVARNIDDLSSAKQVVNQLQGLDEVPVALRSDLIIQLSKRSDIDILTNTYNAQTLRRIIGAADGGDDDLLRSAAEIARRVEDAGSSVARLSDELRPDAFAAVLRSGRVSEATRLIENADGAAGKNLLNDLAPGATRRFLSITVGKADEMRVAIANYRAVRTSSFINEEFLRTDTLNAFAYSLDELQSSNVGNLRAVVNDIALARPVDPGNWNQVQGGIYQVLVDASGDFPDLRRVGTEGTISIGGDAARVADNANDLPDPSKLNGVVDVVPVSSYDGNAGEFTAKLMVIGDKSRIQNLDFSDLQSATPGSVDLSQQYDEVEAVSARFEFDEVGKSDTLSEAKIGEAKSSAITDVKHHGDQSIDHKIARTKSMLGVVSFSNADETPVFFFNSKQSAVDGQAIERTISANGGVARGSTLDELVSRSPRSSTSAAAAVSVITINADRRLEPATGTRSIQHTKDHVRRRHIVRPGQPFDQQVPSPG